MMSKSVLFKQQAFPFYTGAPKKSKRRWKNGYAANPGTGPEGETCKSCNHKTYHECSKRYYKCDLVNWSNGAGTDILLRSPACHRWESDFIEVDGHE